MTISKVIIDRIKKANGKFHSNDNISEYILNGIELDILQSEVEEKMEEVLRSLVIDIDNDPNSRETAKRLAKMYIREIMSGRYQPSPDVTTFPNEDQHIKYTGMLVVRAELKSICSHHHQPVSLVCYIGIIPNKKMLGLSKYMRLAQWCARRGTLQEELCNNIMNTIKEKTECKDVGVYLEGTHGCCENRGVMAYSSLTQTISLSGEFFNLDVKQEFFDNIKLQKMTIKN